MEMKDASTSELEDIRRRTKELISMLGSMKSDSNPEAERINKECVLHINNVTREINEKFSDIHQLESEALAAYAEQAHEEIKAVKTENLKMTDEIKILNDCISKDFVELENDLKMLGNDIEEEFCSQDLDELYIPNADGKDLRCSKYLVQACNFEMLELTNIVNQKRAVLRDLHEYDNMLCRFNDLKQVEGILSDVKVTEFNNSCIRLSVKTFPASELIVSSKKWAFLDQQFATDHELVIELADDTWQVLNAMIYPEDTYIGNVVDAVKSSRNYCSTSSNCIVESSLPWLVRRIQYQILLTRLRHLIIKNASSSRYSLHYLDKDSCISVHLNGVDANILVPDGWPLATCTLYLDSLSNSNSSRYQSDFLQDVQEIANLSDVDVRENLGRFVGAIDELLKGNDLGKKC